MQKTGYVFKYSGCRVIHTLFMSKLSSRKFLSVTLRVFVLCILLSCNQDKFGKAKWTYTNDPLFPSSDRPRMLDDLVSNHKLVGLSYAQLISYLGKPDAKEDKSIIYHIIIDYENDIDPTYTKNLVLTYSKDSVITSLKVVEHRL